MLAATLNQGPRASFASSAGATCSMEETVTRSSYDGDLVDLIGPIYDTVLKPDLWPEVLERIRQTFQFHNAMLGVSALPRGEIIALSSAGISQEGLELFLKYDQYLADAWGGAARLARAPLEEPVVQSEMAAGTDFHNNPYYLHACRPQGIIDAVAIGLARDKATIGSLALGRHESVPPVSQAELAGLRFLAPHITRAVTISRLLEVTVDASVTFEAALEASQRAIVIVTEEQTVVFANQSAQALIEAKDLFAVNSSARLTVRRELVPGQLKAAVAAAAREGDLGRRGMALPVTSSDGTPFVLHVMPLHKRRVRTNFGSEAVAAIFVAEPGRAVTLPGDALALIYGLTPAETRILELVADGRGTREMADALGIAPSTVRTHLLKVFEKTGRHGRIDLLRLFREISLPA